MTEPLKRIRLLTPMASPSWAGEAGDVVEIGKDDADSLVARHQAEYVPSDAEDLVELAAKLGVGLMTNDTEIKTLAKAHDVHVSALRERKHGG